MKKKLSGVLNKSTIIKSLMFSAVALSGSSVFAVSVNGSVGATSVPSLSGSMLVVLSLLLFAVAFRVSKQNKAVNKLFITLLGVGMVVSAGSGIKLISDVTAGIAIPTIDLSGGTFGGPSNVSSPSGGYDAILENNSGQPVTITFTPNAGLSPSRCSLYNFNVPAKPVASKPLELAAVPAYCGDASSNFFNPGETSSVTIQPGMSCEIRCTSSDG